MILILVSNLCGGINLNQFLCLPPLSRYVPKNLKRSFLYQTNSNKLQSVPVSRPRVCYRILPEPRPAIRSRMPEQVRNIREKRIRQRRPK